MLTTEIQEKEPFYYAVHTELRKDAQRFASVRGRWKHLSDEDFLRIKEYYDFHAVVLEHHHRAEDVIYFPDFIKKDPQLEKEILRLKKQHQDLVESIEQIQSAFQRDTRDVLERLFVTYQKHIEAHLEEEEDAVLTPVFSRYSEAELSALSEQMEHHTSLRIAFLKIAWVFDGMNKEMLETSLKKTPFFVPFIYRRFMKPRFDRHVVVFAQFS